MSDLISRSALLDRAYKCVTATAELCVVDSYIIENAPAVDAVPVVHGQWVETKNGFHCSNCCKQPGRHPTKRGVYLSTYCPNCGAKMDGGKDNG